jgi:acyl-CoA oxidase
VTTPPGWLRATVDASRRLRYGSTMAARTALLEDPELRPFLPLLFVAWSDGDLEEADRAKLDEHVARMPWLRPAARIALAAWLDPNDPPSWLEVRELLATIERVSGTTRPERRRDLLALAGTMANEGDGERERAALAALGAELGVADGEEAADDGATARSPHAPAFAIAELRALLDGEHAATRDRVRAFVSDPARRAYGLPVAEYRAKVSGWLGELANEGFGALAYPGVTSSTKDLGAFFAVFETLALGDLSLLVKCGVQFGLFGGSIYFLGRPDQRAALLPGAGSLALPGCFAMSEVGHGSDVQSLETEARWDAQARTFTIVTPRESARKDWIGGAAASARMATVFANLVENGERHGVHAFVVPIRNDDGSMCAGVRAGDSGSKMGLNGVDNGRLWFDEVVVPESALLGRFARMTEDGKYESPIANRNKRFFTMLGTLVGGRISVGSAAVTAAKVGVAIAIRYAATRRQFSTGGENGGETRLIDYPQHQRRLLPRLATTYVLSFAMAGLQSRFIDAQAAGTDGVPAMLKALATTHAVETLAECRRACGAQGYLSVNRLPQLIDDVEIFTTFEGDNTVLLQLVARSLLTGFKNRFENKGLSAIVRHVMKRAHVAATQKNLVAVRRADADHLRDRSFILEALGYREERLLETAAARLRKRLEKKMAPGAAFLEIQEHLVALAWAHADRLAFEWFVERVKGLSGPVADHLHRLGALHGLGRIRAEAGFYFSEGYIDPSKESAMRKETVRLLGELRDSAVDLVDAFGIPDVALAAPIAFMDPAHPRW